MKLYLRLLKLLNPYRGRFVAAIVCMILFSLFNLLSLSTIIPFMGRILITGQPSIATPANEEVRDGIEKVKGMPLAPFFGKVKGFKEEARIRVTAFLDRYSRQQLLIVIVVALLVFTFLRGLASFGREYLMAYIGQGIVKDLRLALYEKLQFLSLDYFSKRRTGTIISRLTNDVGFVDRAVSGALRSFLQQSLSVIIFISTMFIFIPWRLALLSLIIVPLIAYPTARIGKEIRKITTRSQEKMADIYSLLQETISGGHVVRAFSMEDYEIGKFRRENLSLFQVIMKSMKRKSGLSPLVDFLANLGGSVVLLYGGWYVLRGDIAPEYFIFFIAILASLAPPFTKLSKVNVDIQEGLSAGKRIFRMLDSEPSVKEKKDALVLPEIKEGIRFLKVSFSYGKKKVLTDINLEAKVGDIIAIVGPTGVGKTTLVNLIPRFYDPTSGHIEIDNRDIREVTLKSLRGQMGIVTQETILFHDTVRKNIAYGREDISKEEIISATEAANAHGFITKMPEGYETKIGDRGMRLSGGERQRLAIARAILKDPAILILDEATSALDSESERLVQDALDKLMKGRTTFVIAHRLSTVRKADVIVVLDQGKIMERGRHEELLTNGGLYKRLYEMQFQQEY
ncbi:MAG: ABC transporter ATP-binding protein [Nitrospirae bacterium]|nr:ABC transporter ATP-binding protein [Nitrospirota bacterium]